MGQRRPGRCVLLAKARRPFPRCDGLCECQWRRGTAAGRCRRARGLRTGQGEMLEGRSVCLPVCLATLGFLRLPAACRGALVVFGVSGEGVCVCVGFSLQAKVSVCSRYTVRNKYAGGCRGWRNAPGVCVSCFVLFLNQCKCQ